MSAALSDPLPSTSSGKRRFWNFSVPVRPLLTEPQDTIVAVALLITTIAITDWLLVPELNLGLLYCFAILLGANFLDRPQIAAFALICTILNELFSPAPWTGGAVRVMITLIAYVGVGLAVYEKNRLKLPPPTIGLMAQEVALRQEEIALRQEEIARREAVEQQLRSLVEGSPAAIFTIDPDGIILMANEAAHQLLGFENQNLPGRSIDEFLPVLAALRQTSRVRHVVRTMIECTGSRRNRQAFLAHVWVSSFGPPSATGLTAVVFDSSQQFRDREEEGLQALANNSRIIMGAFWHETRNLCTAMRVTANSMKRIPAVAESEEIFALNSLIAGLEKLASGELRPESEREFECASLRSVLDQLRIVIEPWFQESGIAVVWQFADQLLMIRADHHGILQVFLNIARNAHRVLENSERKEFSISASVEEGHILVRFRNSGPPVPDPVRIFAPFHPESSGRGIGLYVSRAIVRSFGGDLRYEALEDSVCFTVLLERGGLWYMYKTSEQDARPDS